jgi:hypothetical protein
MPQPSQQNWNRPEDPVIAWKAKGETELLVPLRYGDLIAQDADSGNAPTAVRNARWLSWPLNPNKSSDVTWRSA